MTTAKGRVVYLYQRDPQQALERLNRVTGLTFAHWPESLLAACEAAAKRTEEVVEGAAPDGGPSALRQ